MQHICSVLVLGTPGVPTSAWFEGSDLVWYIALQVGGFVLIALSLWVGFMAYKEKRRWLLTWASVYGATSLFMTLVTYVKGPDPHDMFGCSVPFSLWVGCLFVATLSYYTR